MSHTRTHPLHIAAAAILCTLGAAGILGRLLHTYTEWSLVEPFATLAFLFAVAASLAGGYLTVWLILRGLRAEVKALRAENAELRARVRDHQELLDAVKAADQQGEINGVRLSKVMDMIRDVRTHQLGDEKTDPRGIPRLHRINGGA